MAPDPVRSGFFAKSPVRFRNFEKNFGPVRSGSKIFQTDPVRSGEPVKSPVRSGSDIFRSGTSLVYPNMPHGFHSWQFRGFQLVMRILVQVN